jgi:hypothetical protein
MLTAKLTIAGLRRDMSANGPSQSRHCHRAAADKSLLKQAEAVEIRSPLD